MRLCNKLFVQIESEPRSPTPDFIKHPGKNQERKFVQKTNIFGLAYFF